MTNIGRKRTGFTLIELLIVIAIVAILSTLALTSFNYYKLRVKADDGQTLVFEIMRAEESFRALRGTYTSDCSVLNGQFDMPLSGRYHTVSCALMSAGATAFEGKVTALLRSGYCTDTWKIRQTGIPCHYVDGTGKGTCPNATCPAGY